MGFRSFIEQLEREGKLTRIHKQVSTDLELAGIIEALGEKGRWVEPGGLRRADETGTVTRVITTSTFINNIRTLSSFLAAGH